MMRTILGAAALSLLAGTASAAVLNYTSFLDGAQANMGMGTGSSATGTATLAVDTDAQTLDFRLDVEGITLDRLASVFLPGGANGALGPIHIHNAPAGANGPITIPYPFDETYTATAMGFVLEKLDYDFGAATALAGVAPTFEQFVAALDAGLYYINIHTNEFGGGEIRGQIAPVPLPAGALLVLTGLGALGFARRRKGA